MGIEDLKVAEIIKAETLTVSSAGVSYKYAKEKIQETKDKYYTNEELGIIAKVSSSGRDKIISNVAVQKSISNGFTKEQHNEIASKIGKLFKYGILISIHKDKNNSADVIAVKRFAPPIVLKENICVAYITVKETKEQKHIPQGHSIYSIEEIKVEQLFSNMQLHKEPASKQIALIHKITEIGEKVKEINEKLRTFTINDIEIDEMKNFINILEYKIDKAIDEKIEKSIVKQNKGEER